MDVYVQRIDPKSFDLEAFLASWFGPRSSVDGLEGPEGAELALLPAGLRKWFELIGRWKIPISGVKEIVYPSKMKKEGQKSVFMGDHGGWAWAFDPNTPLVVYEAQDDQPWRPLRGEWSDIFLYHVFTEAVMAAPVVQWCAGISENDLRRVVLRCREVAFDDSGWPAPGWRWYVAEDLLVEAGPRMGSTGGFALTIGAKTEQAIENLNLPKCINWWMRKKGCGVIPIMQADGDPITPIIDGPDPWG